MSLLKALVILAFPVLAKEMSTSSVSQGHSELEERLCQLETKLKKLEANIRSCCGHTPVCPTNWTLFNDSCWFYVDNPVNWQDAKHNCEQHDAHLAVIHSDQENMFAFSLVYNSTTNENVSCFQKHSGKLLVGFAEATTAAQDESTCLQRCLRAELVTGVPCQSILYFPDEHECVLNSETRFSQPNFFQQAEADEKVDYFDNFCPSNFGIVLQQQDNNSKICFDEFPQKVLLGHAAKVVSAESIGNCQKQCSRTSGDANPCNSGMYFPLTKDCVLNKESRKTLPDLFTSDNQDNVTYFDNLCQEQRTFMSARQGQNISGAQFCKMQPIDLVLLVDGSGSVGANNFKRVKNFLKLIVDELDIDRGSQVTMVQFDDKVYSEFHFNAYHTKADIKDAIDKVKYRGGWTKIGKALQFVLDNELTTSSGDNPNNPDYIIVLTDGQSQDKVGPSSDSLRQKGVKLFAIGITNEVFDDQLLKIAGSSSSVFKVKEFSHLDNALKDSLKQELCATMPTEHRDPGFWIGLAKTEPDGLEHWIDGSKLDFKNWFRTKHKVQAQLKKCVHVHSNLLETWTLDDCAAKRTFMCQMVPV